MALARNLNGTWMALRTGYGLIPLLAGADKFTNLLCDWDQYLSAKAARRLPVKPRTFMKAVGVIEMGVGAAILTKWTRIGSYVCAGWLTAIAANLIADRKYDIAVRDLGMALAAFSLGRLTEARLELQPERELPPPRRPSREVVPPRRETLARPEMHV